MVVTKSRSRTQLLPAPDFDGIVVTEEEIETVDRKDSGIGKQHVIEPEQKMEIDIDIDQTPKLKVEERKQYALKKPAAAKVEKIEIEGDFENEGKENIPKRESKLSAESALTYAPKRKSENEIDVFQPQRKRTHFSNETAQSSNFAVQIPHRATLQGQRQCIMASLLDSLKQEQELERIALMKNSD